MCCNNLQLPQPENRARLESVQINFLVPKPDSPRTLTPQHFQPERIFGWTSRLSIQLFRQLTFSKAIDTAARRLGLRNDCGFYFNCLPEHAEISGLKPVEVVPTNTPEQEGLRAGVQVYVFVSCCSRTTTPERKITEDDLIDDIDEAVAEVSVEHSLSEPGEQGVEETKELEITTSSSVSKPAG